MIISHIDFSQQVKYLNCALNFVSMFLSEMFAFFVD